MKSPLKLLTICIYLFLATNANAQSFSWAQGIIADKTSLFPTTNVYQSIATDSHHNIIVAGKFQGNLTIGSASYTSPAYSTFGYIAKYDSSGNLLWSKAFTGTSADPKTTAEGVTTDDNDNIFVTGTFSTTAIYFSSSDSVINAGNAAIGHTASYIVKYDAAGNFKWATATKEGTLGSGATGSAIALDKSGNIFIGGIFADSLTIGSLVITEPLTVSSLYIAKYDSWGNPIWAKAYTSPQPSAIAGIAADPSGNVFITGYTDSSLTVDTGIVFSTRPQKVFTVKLNPSGSYLWGKVYGGQFRLDQFDHGNAIAADNSGNVYVAASIEDSFHLTTPYESGVVLKYSTTGTLDWQFKTPDSVNVYGVALDVNGYPYITGDFNKRLFTLGSINLNATDTQNIFVSKLDRISGNPVWAITGGTHRTYSRAITVDQNGGGIAIAGFFNNTTTIGTSNLTSSTANYYNNMFVAHVPNNVLAVSGMGSQQADYQVYPNPANNTLVIKNAAVGTNYNLYNILGQQLRSGTISSNTEIINTEDLKLGTYILQLTDKNGYKTSKSIVKQ
jgi:hypothetical protein